MNQPLTDANMPPQAPLGDWLRPVIKWSRTNAPAVQWRSRVGPQVWTVRVNDFPDEHLYTLLVDDKAVGDFDEWPRQWLRSEGLSDETSAAHPRS
jgi:hypothetical protein